MDVKILKEHKKDCFSVRAVKEGTWETPLCFIDERPIYRAKDGTKRGGDFRWYIFNCNDPSCKAEIMVKEGFLLKAVYKKITKAVRNADNTD